MKLFLVVLQSEDDSKTVTVDRAPDVEDLRKEYQDASSSTGEKLLNIVEIPEKSPAARAVNIMLSLSDVNPGGTLSDDFNELLTMTRNLEMHSR